jgi:hypothetical protein
VALAFFAAFGTNASTAVFNYISATLRHHTVHRPLASRLPPSIQEQLDAIDVEAARNHLIPTQATVNSRKILGLWGENSVSYLRVFSPQTLYSTSQLTSEPNYALSDEIRIYDEVRGRLMLDFRFRPRSYHYNPNFPFPRCRPRSHNENLCYNPAAPKTTTMAYTFTYLHTIDPYDSGQNVVVGEFTLPLAGLWGSLSFPVIISAPMTGPGRYTIEPIVQEGPQFHTDVQLPHSSERLTVPPKWESPRSVSVFRDKLQRYLADRPPGNEKELDRPLSIPDALSATTLKAYGLMSFWFPPQDQSVMVAEYPSGYVVHRSSGEITVFIDLKGYDLDKSGLNFGPCQGQFFFHVSFPASDIKGTFNEETVYSHEPRTIPPKTLWSRFGQAICSQG